MKAFKSFCLFSFLFFLSGCARPLVGGDGCFRTLESARAASKKNGNNIVVIATMEGDDAQSTGFLDAVVRAPGFSAVTERYSVVLMDFSRNSFDSTVAAEDADKSAQKEAAQNENIMQENALTAKLLNVSLTPSFYLLSKDGCFVSELDFIEELSSPDDFITLIESYSGRAEAVNTLAQRTRSGTPEERLSALNELYDSTEAVYRPFLRPFIEAAIKLSASNPGVKSKFLMARTDAASTELYLGGNPAAAVQGYVRLAGNKALTPEYRQQAWYMAGYLLAMADSSSYELVLQYLRNAVQAAPESPDAASIQRAINEITGN